MLFENLQVLRDPAPGSAAHNMALDEVLLASVGEPTLRLYEWARPALSIGCFSRHAEAAAAWPGRELVRRITGGGVVPHGADLTYTLALPAAHALVLCGPRESYRAIHAAIARWLGKCALAPAPVQRGGVNCFEAPVEFDILSSGEKIAGAAQKRTRLGLLHQGSIQLPATAAMRAEFPAAFTVQWRERTPSERELAAAAALAEQRYASAQWTQRI